jgi:parallel beta-helix repeat protein
MTRKIYKFFYVIFVSLLLTSFCGIFQTQATLTPGVQTVDSEGNVGIYTSLVLDSDDNPHISYGGNANLKYAKWSGSGWDIQIVDSRAGSHSSIALDSSGNPHISYQGNTDLRYAKWSGSGWDIQIVDLDRSSFSSLALDSSDNPHISYIGGSDLKYATYDGSVWHTETVDSTSLYWSSSLALDSSDKAHISYYDIWNGYLKYATLSDSMWKTEFVDSGGEWGLDVSLALDSSDNPHISYGGYGELKYAKSSRSIWDIEILDWHSEIVDSSGGGSFCSLALDSNDNPHISYYEDSNKDLRYAKWFGSNWDIRIVDSSGDVGVYSSLALDSSDKAHISYLDNLNIDLKYVASVDPASYPASPPSPPPTPPSPPSPTPTDSGIIYINPDGSVEGTNKIQQNGAIYTFTDDIEGSIIVQRDNPSQSDIIIIDGAGYTLQGNGTGIGVDISGMYRVTVTNITIRQFQTGIYCTQAGSLALHANRLFGNSISNCSIGIHLESSQSVILRNNTMFDNDNNFILSGAYDFYLDHDVDSSNTVNGKPICYWINRQNMEVPPDAGTVILVKCSDITVRNLQLSNNGAGIRLISTKDSTITNNIVTSNNYGIYLSDSQNITINGNSITANKDGILIEGESNSNNLKNNILNSNERNLNLVFSSNLATNVIDESNTINGKPVYYWVNRQNMEVPPNAGYVALIDCRGVTVKNQHLSNNQVGILIVGTTNSTIANNTFSNNSYGITCFSSGNLIAGNNVTNNNSWGIYLLDASNNTLLSNYMALNKGAAIYLKNCSDNVILNNNLTKNGKGIYLYYAQNNTIVGNVIEDNNIGLSFFSIYVLSSGNLIYHNDLVNNTQQVNFSYVLFGGNAANTWDNGETGNYWSNYNGTDANHNGIGDMPYIINDYNQDNYPLMEPYIIPEFPSWITPLLFLAITLFVVIFKKHICYLSET